MMHHSPVPAKSQKVRQAQASRFGRRLGQEGKEVDSDENMEIVEEVEKLAKESPFIDLETRARMTGRQSLSEHQVCSHQVTTSWHMER